MAEYASRFEKEFILFSCLSSTIAKGVRFVDSGASHHMTGLLEIIDVLV